MTFIVRLSVDAAGRATGVIERVSTGEKERFQGMEHISDVIAQMVKEHATE